MMKIHIIRAKVFVKARFKSEGSVLRETVQAAGLGFETRCELESDEPADKVAAVVRNAEKGCCYADDSSTNTSGTSIYAKWCPV